METRVMNALTDGQITTDTELPADKSRIRWTWLDVHLDNAASSLDALVELTSGLKLDPLAVRDAAEEWDLPKVDDFGHHLVIVLHGLEHQQVRTYEVDCFLTNRALVTVHSQRSPSIDALWEELVRIPGLSAGGADELLARLADVLTRRLLLVVEAFDEQYLDMIERALNADEKLLEDLTAVRSDLATIKRVVNPQRETLDVLRSSGSNVISSAGRRRFADVFDVASRTTAGLDAARTALAETLDAYRGAEARQATDVTKVLTVYAAIMLPLSLIAGFFGMNFTNLPWMNKPWGWGVVTGIMAFIAVLSLGVFVALGWIQRPSGRKAGRTLGKGLIEAARAPVQVVGAMYEISTMPLRREDSEHHNNGGRS
ncbi:MAG: magnesium transporter CorA family protein [Acidimicrobiia bacterium]|nr:magnesium transporter CorA family protein [Acidimicrobiia bacterium]NNL29301.1 magnesium transporter CorA family protein [Acidimicrobiia bacterium]